MSYEVLARAIARNQGRAFATVSSFDVTQDVGPVFGIAPIKVVSEEIVQAIAFGRMDQAPTVVKEHQPLSRRSAFLEPFADALNSYVEEAIAAGSMRIYFPHQPALECLALMGERFERNREATDTIRRMGYHCRIIHELAEHPGQQAIIVMTDVIQRHLVTGQSPTKDASLRSLLVWMQPPAGGDVALAADAAALVPSAAILERADDDAVEHLRNEMRRRPRVADAARARIEAIQERGALEEWSVLCEARTMFWSLGLNPNPALLTLLADNLEWFRRRLETPRPRSTRAIAMSRIFDDFDHYQRSYGGLKISADRLHFERTRLDGRGFVATVTAKNFSARGEKPKIRDLSLRIEPQPFLRLRRGTAIRGLASRIMAVVRAVGQIDENMFELVVSVESGMTAAQVGLRDRWVEGHLSDLRAPKSAVYRAVTARAPHLLSDALPAAAGALDPRVDILARLRELEEQR